jgi:hypothetical protein
MQPLLKVIGFFIGLFAILNGVWIVVTPPYGDEPQGYMIIIAGCIVLICILLVAYNDFVNVRRKKEYY